MDRIEIFNWAGERKVKEMLANLGYEHKAVIHDDVHVLSKKFLEEGLNVMILQGKKDVCDFVLALDTKSFYQR